MMGGTSGLGDLDELYEAIILDQYRSPRNSAPVDDPDVDLEVNNPFCGDEFHIQLKAVSYTHLPLPTICSV